MAAQKLFEASGGESSDPSGPVPQWTAMHRLDSYEARHAAGEKYAMMIALRVCANHDLPMPRWLSSAYIAAFDAINNYRAASWEEVFGAALPKGKHLKSLRNRRERVFKVGNEITNRLLRAGVPSATEKPTRKRALPVGEELFESVASELNLTTRQVKEAYTAYKRALGYHRSRRK